MLDKYPRIFHLPQSKGASNDDKIAKDYSSLIFNPIVITEKLDGGNCSLERNGVFARSHANIPSHPSFDWLKSFHSSIKHKLPENIQLFGENLWAKHSIEYSELPNYFLLFGVRQYHSGDDITWASWEETKEWANEIEVPIVPVLKQGAWSKNSIDSIVSDLMEQPSTLGGEREGLVIRLANEFNDDDFSTSIFKMVRPNHVQSSEHWSHQSIIRNKLKAT